ncbi:alkaline phosphatase PhoX [Kribbella qitaiheensis]|uniref:alkaline phosphatase PhoX n=1 Tax=Kribbella qitaiheensis TaxID=1544730 RepID=UPI001C643633
MGSVEALFTAEPALGTSGPKVGYGPMIPDPAGMLDLPHGFSYKIVSREGVVRPDGLQTPSRFDGMGTFPDRHGGNRLVRNHECSPTATIKVVARKPSSGPATAATPRITASSSRSTRTTTAATITRPADGDGQVPARGGYKLEGCWWGQLDRCVYFVSSFARTELGPKVDHDGQVWRFDPREKTLKQMVIFTRPKPGSDDPEFDAPDNITMSPYGGLMMCEDGLGEQHILGTTEDGQVFKFAATGSTTGPPKTRSTANWRAPASPPTAAPCSSTSTRQVSPTPSPVPGAAAASTTSSPRAQA